MAVTIKNTQLTAFIEQGQLKAEVHTERNGTRRISVKGLAPIISEETHTFENQDQLDIFILEISNAVTVLKQLEQFATDQLTFK